MKNVTLTNTAILFCLFCATGLNAQQPQPAKTIFAPVPRLVRWNSSFRPTNGQPAAPVESVTLSIYGDQKDGTPLWSEMQNAALDADGRYSLLIGSTLPDGVPADLFVTGAPRWLGIRFNRPGEEEQPRILLASVPYALKAADAETLGGRPASDYLLSPPAAAAEAAIRAGTGASLKEAGAGRLEKASVPTVAANSGEIDVAINNSGGTITGYSVQNLAGGAAAYSGMLFYDQNGQLAQFQGFNNSTHEYRINNIAPGGTINFMLSNSSKFLVRSDGDIDISGNVRKGGTPFINGAGDSNAGLGNTALANNAGTRDNAVGSAALGGAPGNTGNYNNAFGVLALTKNTSGFGNNALGDEALTANTTGADNSALGDSALHANNGNSNTAVGASALLQLATGGNNLALGYQAGLALTGAESFNIILGSQGVVGDNNTTRIGSAQSRAFISGIRGVTTGVANAVAVVIDSNGQLGTVNSSRRFKQDIQDMGEASVNLMRLRPVTYRYQQPYADGSQPADYGLIAEEVAEVYPDLVVKGADGQVETVQYQKLTPMLLNEVQRQHAEIQALAQQNQDLQRRLATLEAALVSHSANR